MKNELQFKALGTSYNLSVRYISEFHDLIDYGGFKRKWIHKKRCKPDYKAYRSFFK